MAGIQANTGLISGIPITQTVDSLMKIEARPRDLLVSRAKDLKSHQGAITELLTSVITVQLASRNLSKPSVFGQKTVTSSDKSLLTATANGTPAAGTYRFTPVRQATSQQLLSTGFASTSEPIGAGEFSLGFGGFVDQPIELSQLNGGAGVSRGKIRITDRSGESAVVDLRFAQTIDDVLQAINTTDSIQVSAVAEGDRIRLTDRTGSTTANLRVQEVSGGSTAADLGLASINAAADTATGSDVVKLYTAMGLDQLNDGSGIAIQGELADFNVTFRDGTSLAVDLHRSTRAEDFAKTTTTGVTNAKITLTAKTKGAALDGVRVVFVEDGGVTQGNETVTYDDSDPANKTLTVNIAAGATTADDVIAAITGDAVAGAKFAAARATGSNGAGLITESYTGVTLGGAALATRKEKTLGELLTTINETDPTRLKAEISADGDRLVLTDLTSDEGTTFAVTSVTGGAVAEDLGLTGASVGGVLTGKRLASGLKTTLLSSLGGGNGIGTLGALTLTDRGGASATVNLAAAETLDDVIKTINSAGLGITAKINSARSGLELSDTTGAIASNFKVVNGDVTNTATKLKIATDAATDRVDSGTLARQSMSVNTLLSSLNGGKGVERKSFFINDSKGATTVVRLDTSEDIQTVGDLLDAINALSIGVEARLNDAGDGILIVDTAGGTGQPNIRDIGSGTTAKDLHLTGAAKEVTINGQPTKVLEGSQRLTVTVSATDKLGDVVTKINNLGAGFTASILSDGTGVTPHRLSIQSNIAGKDGNLLVESTFGKQFEELTRGQDALLEIGGGANTGVIISSKTSTFENAVAGVSVTVVGQSLNPVTVTVTQSDSSVVSTVQQWVDSYNKLRDKLATYTSFDEEAATVGILFGSLEALRVDSELSTLISGRTFGAGEIQALKEVGIDVKDDGKLNFDATKLQAKFAEDASAVEKFFTTAEKGFAVKFDKAIESMAGAKNSLLVNKARSLQDRIDVYQDRVDVWTARLTLKRESLLKKFYTLETTLGKLQSNISYLQSIQYIPPVGSASA